MSGPVRGNGDTVPPLEAAREVTRIARAVVEADSAADRGEMLGALLISAGHAAVANEMSAQEFVALASRCYAHAQRQARVNRSVPGP